MDDDDNSINDDGDIDNLPGDEEGNDEKNSKPVMGRESAIEAIKKKFKTHSLPAQEESD